MTEQAEITRLLAAWNEGTHWRKWGPYLSERQWGTVREDYSENGNAWDYFSHDQSRSRAYRWGEDGLAGFSDDKQTLCFALALWNGKDPILKERLFGLTNSEGNHGEDVKEYYFYLDSTPTHSYMKYLYKYPQRAYPYEDLVKANRSRSREEMEYELLDTGIFNDDRYFDVFVEYAKESVEDVLIKITVFNRGPEAASLHLLPTLWFRNQWSCSDSAARPFIHSTDAAKGTSCMAASHPELGERFLYCEGEPLLLFTENETNNQRIHGTPNHTPFVKDAFDRYIVHGAQGAVNPDKNGTKACADYQIVVGPGESKSIRLRLVDISPGSLQQAYPKAEGDPLGKHFDSVMDLRLSESDEFYKSITPAGLTEDAARVMRQALAGMLWSKQYYSFEVERWLEEHGADQRSRNTSIRNHEWDHMVNDDIISMPDKWEYPWYAAWDLAFHTASLSIVDVDFAKQQLNLMLDHSHKFHSYVVPSAYMPINIQLIFSLCTNSSDSRWGLMILNRSLLSLFQERRGSHMAKHLNHASNEPRPSRLMTGAQASTVVAVKVLVEQDGVLPVRIGLELLCTAVNRTPVVFVPQENST